MLSLFRTNQLLWSVLLLLYAGVLHSSVFLLEDQWEPGAYGVFSAWIYSTIGYKGLIPDLLTIFLLFVQGALLNGLNLNHRFAEEVSLFPGLLFVLVASLLPEFLHLSPLHLANIFYIIALFELLSIYNSKHSEGNIFNAGLWIGIGSLFYFSHLILLLLAFASLAVLRAFDLRERFMLLSGLAVPYLLSGLYFFWVDQWDYFLLQQFGVNYDLLDFPLRGYSNFTYLKLGLFALLLLIVLFNRSRYVLRRIMQEQKKINILFWGLLLAPLTLLFQANIHLDHLLLLSIPLGLLLSINFINMRPNWAELFHFLLFLTALLLQYRSQLLEGLGI